MTGDEGAALRELRSGSWMKGQRLAEQSIGHGRDPSVPWPPLIPPTSPRAVLSSPELEAPVRLNPLNAETSLAALQPAVTPTRGFFIRSHFPTPSLDASTWRLGVGGEVEKPRKWTLAELRDLPTTRVVATLECAGNSRSRLPNIAEGELRWGDRAIGAAVWEGVPLSVLLEESRPRQDAHQIVFTGAEKGSSNDPARRFSRGLSIDTMDRVADILIATEMNGEPLSPDHGWPARLIVPGWYGMAWVKWLSRIHLRKEAFRGYYQATRYVYAYQQNGERLTKPVTRIRVKSLIISPLPGDRLAWGRSHIISGKAWSGSGPVTRVEVDAGSGWMPASVRSGDGPYDWCSWEFAWSPERRGPVLLRVRATDAEGETQPEEPFLNEFQYGMNAVHSVEVIVS